MHLHNILCCVGDQERTLSVAIVDHIEHSDTGMYKCIHISK